MVKLHRISDEELPAVLALLSSAGGTARTAETWQQDRMTALVLGDRGSPQAAMPMSCRAISAARGRELSAGWLSSNQFASKMGLRRQTRHTPPDWPGLLPELDALLVMRRDESSLAGRWYAQAGFEDLLSIRCLYLDMKSPPVARAAGAAGSARYQVRVATPSDAAWAGEAAYWQEQMLAVYHDVYGSYGGPRQRSAGFWSPALAHHYYREHYQFQIIGLWNAAGAGAAAMLMGYAVVGWSGWHSKRPRMDILELATRQWDTAAAGDLIRTTCQLAWSKNVHQVRAVVSSHDPYRGHLARTGFADRWGYVMMAKWLHAQRYLDRLATGDQGLPRELGEIAIELAVPGAVPLTLRGSDRGGGGLGGAAGGGMVMHLQGSGRTITRLLFNRLDIAAAVQEGTLSPAGGGENLSDGEIARLSLAFPWTPWAFHMLDYI